MEHAPVVITEGATKRPNSVVQVSVDAPINAHVSTSTSATAHGRGHADGTRPSPLRIAEVTAIKPSNASRSTSPVVVDVLAKNPEFAEAMRKTIPIDPNVMARVVHNGGAASGGDSTADDIRVETDTENQDPPMRTRTGKPGGVRPKEDRPPSRDEHRIRDARSDKRRMVLDEEEDDDDLFIDDDEEDDDDDEEEDAEDDFVEDEDDLSPKLMDAKKPSAAPPLMHTQATHATSPEHKVRTWTTEAEGRARRRPVGDVAGSDDGSASTGSDGSRGSGKSKSSSGKSSRSSGSSAKARREDVKMRSGKKSVHKKSGKDGMDETGEDRPRHKETRRTESSGRAREDDDPERASIRRMLILDDIREATMAGFAPPFPVDMNTPEETLLKVRGYQDDLATQAVYIGVMGSGLTSLVGLVQTVNERFDPVGRITGHSIKLQGARDRVEQNLPMYRRPFVRIYKKMKKSGMGGEIPPWLEITLITVGILKGVHMENTYREMAEQARQEMQDPTSRMKAEELLRTKTAPEGKTTHAQPRPPPVQMPHQPVRIMQPPETYSESAGEWSPSMSAKEFENIKATEFAGFATLPDLKNLARDNPVADPSKETPPPAANTTPTVPRTNNTSTNNTTLPFNADSVKRAMPSLSVEGGARTAHDIHMVHPNAGAWPADGVTRGPGGRGMDVSETGGRINAKGSGNGNMGGDDIGKGHVGSAGADVNGRGRIAMDMSGFMNGSDDKSAPPAPFIVLVHEPKQAPGVGNSVQITPIDDEEEGDADNWMEDDGEEEDDYEEGDDDVEDDIDSSK